MTIDNVFDIGDMVYIKHDPRQELWQVTAIQVFAEGELIYKLSCGTDTSWHYDFELSNEKRISL